MARINRRTMLRGAGAALALPMLDAMTPRSAKAAAASAGPPLRMGIFTVAGGTVIESWKPDYTGKLDKLPSILRPLEEHKDDLLIVSGLSHHGRSSGTNAHEHCGYLHLTGAPKIGKVGGRPQADISVDQMAAKHIGGETFLPSLEVGYASHEQKYSFKSPHEPVPYEGHPRMVFDRMFRGRRPIVPDWKKLAEASDATQAAPAEESLDRSVLDLVSEDAKRLMGRVGSRDRKTLEQYLDSVRSVEKRVVFLERQAVAMARDGVGGREAEIPKNLPEASTPWYDIRRPVSQDPEPHGEYIEIMSDLMVLAFQTNTTRVMTMALGSDGALFPGVVTVGFERHAHTLEHNGNARRIEDADPIAREGCRQIHAWYTSMFAKLVAKMKAIDEGGTSLLDNTMLLYTSYMADGGHGRQDYPAMFVGGAAGTLKTGRHIAYPQGTPVSNLYVEMLHRMGVPVSEFGESRTSPAAAYDGRLPGLV